MYIMQEDLQLHLNILPPFPKGYDSEILTFTFHHTGITGYLVSKDVTPTGKPGEFLHLFWEGAYWVVCEGPRESARQPLYRTRSENIFLDVVSCDVNEYASAHTVEFETQRWTPEGLMTFGSLGRSDEGEAREVEPRRSLLP